MLRSSQEKKRSSQKKTNFRRKNKTQKKMDGGFWEIFGFPPDSAEVTRLKEQRKLCDTTAKTSIDQTKKQIKSAEEAIKAAKQSIEKIKADQKDCNARKDKEIENQRNKEKGEKLLQKSQGEQQQFNPINSGAPPAPLAETNYEVPLAAAPEPRYMTAGGKKSKRSKRSKRSKK
jgi:hypothetical protein